MGSRPSLKKQVIDRLYSLDCLGQSRLQAKQQFIDQAKTTGLRGWITVNLPGIYSVETMKTYRKESINFVEWAKFNYGCRYLDEAKVYVSDYLRYRLSLNHSAWSLKVARDALRKLYQDSALARDVFIPVRKKNDIKRSRNSVQMDKKFSPTRNRNLIDFARATGLRRHELRELLVKDVKVLDGKLMVFVRQGKGGRCRNVPVLQAFSDRVMEFISEKNPDDFLFSSIPVRADIHSYRRDYAASLYQELSGNKYDSRSKDQRFMKIVSAALGHNRLDIVRRNYLD